jgi:hypothetical protein
VSSMRATAVVAAALTLAACTGPAGLPGAHPAADRDVARVVMSHYERFGVEEDFNCLAAYMDGITRWEVLEETADGLVVRVGYFYKDRVRSDPHDDAMLRVGPLLYCSGFGERVFTLDLSGERPLVVEMSGPVVGGPRT